MGTRGTRGSAQRWVRRVVAVVVGAVATFAGLPLGTAFAAGTVSITPASTSTPSGVAATFTLTVSCSTTGGCTNTTVTFPTTTVTGNGANTDFAAWVGNSSCPGVTKTVGAGQITFNYGTVPTGTRVCTFPVTPPRNITFNNAQATITPTVNGSNFASSTGAPAVLTVTAGHNASLTKFAPPTVVSGQSFTYQVAFHCGQNDQYNGNVGLSALTLSDQLPANFTYSSYSVRDNLTLPGTFNHDPVTRTFTYSDPTGTTCGSPPLLPNANLFVIFITGTASTAGVPNPVGTTICNSATSNFTYLDGTPGTSTTPSQCSTVANLTTGLTKLSASNNLPNSGQYRFPPDNGTYTYTYPGNWDSSNIPAVYSVVFDAGSSPNAGLAFDLKDPLPCLDNFAGSIYSSNAPGTLCQNPAFIPTRINATGFTPTAADLITLIHPNGTNSTVAPVGGVWTIPTSPAVAEINFPPFASEGSNFARQMSFVIRGWASPSVTTTSLLRNTVTGAVHSAGSPTPIGPPTNGATHSANLMIVSNVAPSGVVIQPHLTATNAGICTENVYFNSPTAGVPSVVEIATGPSQAIYIDYLAPAGATVTSGHTGTWTLNGLASGRNFVTPSLTPTATPNFNGTGRTLYRWVIPAGTATVGGEYRLLPSSPYLVVSLGAGCAGTYQNDLTIGYGGPVTSCIFNASPAAPAAQLPPMFPAANADLRSNGSPTPNNYCGTSAPYTVAATNPGFDVDKTVQGNLDGAPISSGGIGNVSPAGGTATYNVTFTNTGGATLGNPVMYDLLPRIGDTQASSTTPRNSQFPVTLTSVGPLPPNVTVAYSMATNPCRPEVLPTNPGCVDDWTTTPPASLATVTALRMTYSGAVVVAGVPGTNSFTVPYTVSTPPSTAGSVAWNTVGTNAQAGVGGAPIGAAESSATGLRAQTEPAITKVATTSSYAAPGDTVGYTFTVTNNTTVTLTNVGVVDNLVNPAPGAVAPPVTCQSLSGPAGTCSGATTTLLPGQTGTFTATYTVTQADVDAGSISDTATVTAHPPTGADLTNTSTQVTVPAVVSAGITMSKTPDKTTVSTVGETITYTFALHNAGNVGLTNVQITDPMPGLSAITCGGAPLPIATLPAGGDATCIATYQATANDFLAGRIMNTATASGTPPQGAPVTSPPASAAVQAPAAPSLTLTKSAQEPDFDAAGDVLHFDFVVTNTGNVPVTGLVVNDQLPGTAPVTCDVTSLAPGASAQCSTTYMVTANDLDAGGVTNTATATASAPGGPVTSPLGSVSVGAVQTPGITIDKDALETSFAAAGATIHYTFHVENTGNVTLTGVGVTDLLPGLSAISCPSTTPPNTLQAGASMECTATYVTSQADVNAGGVNNTATATGTPPATAGPAVNDQDSHSVSSLQTAAISMDKSVIDTQLNSAGQVVDYVFVVSNPGNVTLTDVTVTDPLPGLSPINCNGQTTLAPNASMTCTATYTVTQSDIDNLNQLINSATATGTPPAGPPVTATDSAPVPPVQAPSLSIDKTATEANFDAAGDILHFQFIVENTGNMTLNNLVVNDPLPGISAVVCPNTQLAPAPSPARFTTCTATYTVTQADVDNGGVTNTAAASATTPGGQAVNSAPDELIIDADQVLDATFEKRSATPTYTDAGQILTFTFPIENTGNVTIMSESIVDHLAGVSTVTCPGTLIPPGGSLECSATYTVTQDDVDDGSIMNDATLTVTGPPSVQQPLVLDDDVTLTAIQAPEISIVKRAIQTSFDAVGDTINYEFEVRNSGNLTLSNVVVDDPLPGITIAACPDTTLVPDQVTLCTGTYTTTQADLDAAQVTNTATVSAEDVNEDPVSATSESVVVDADQQPSLALTKAADAANFDAVGDQITYTFVISNTGNVTLSGVNLTDALVGMTNATCGTGDLAPGESTTCTGSYTVIQADIDAGSIVNEASVAGTPPSGLEAVTADATASVPGVQTLGIALVKSVEEPSYVAGTTLHFRFQVTNTGNTTLNGVAVNDPMPGLSAVSCPTTTLAPGESTTCTATYTATAADVTAGQLTNTATASGAGLTTTTVSEPSTVQVAAVVTPPPTTPPPTPDPGQLPATGQGNALQVVVIAGVLLLLGLVAVGYSRRRRRSTAHG